MIGYAIDAAIKSNITDNVVVNTDCDRIKAYVALRSDVSIYSRDPSLANDTATGDDFTADIIKNLKPETLIIPF